TLAASFQEAVVDCLVGKAFLALQTTESTRLCIGGGVACNTRLREKLTAESQRLGVDLLIPPLKLCTDNAAMGAIAIEQLRLGNIAELDLDVRPGLVRMPK
ncbi:MAG: tRNA (adenosine(37)-N6)-threonylcarbamoyltransferase complex transferase subunit TsaD, partial [Planctomycetota bacterium]|nr:tRNA (adenosine(37)-N6)-threonylcarbamoyltransferase complex transferase subunit TsaD [Planctomycetota bacterium]